MLLINLILRIIVSPLLLALCMIKFNYVALRTTFRFLRWGGEWVTYTKEDPIAIQQVWDEMKQQRKSNQN